MRLVHCYLPVFRAIIFGATFDATGKSTGVAAEREGGEREDREREKRERRETEAAAPSPNEPLGEMSGILHKIFEKGEMKAWEEKIGRAAGAQRWQC